MRVGITNFGFLYHLSLESCLEVIARAGYRLVEITPTPPHVLVTELDEDRRRRLRKQLDSLDLECASINAAELNLISPNRDIRELALRHYRECIALAQSLGARMVVVIPGRQSPLIPMPREDAWRLAVEQLSLLAADAAAHQVNLAIETVPFGFAETTAEVAALAREVGGQHVGITLDVANIFGKEDVAKAVKLAGGLLMVAHLSDTWRNRWAHTSLGEGEVDFHEFVQALDESGFQGPFIYELVDGMDPEPRLARDLAALEQLGLSR
jgi:sugar phosphate isomerase/epimerase